MNYSKLIVGISLLILFSNCEKSPVYEDASIQDRITEDNPKWLKAQKNKNKNNIYNYLDKIQWGSAKEVDKGDYIITQVKVKLLKNFKIKYNERAINNYALIIMSSKSTNEVFSYLVGSHNNLRLDSEQFFFEIFSDRNIYILNRDFNYQDQVKVEQEICYELVEVWSDGSTKPTGITWCVVAAGSIPPPSGSNGGGGGTSGSSEDSESTLDQDLREWLEHIYDAKLEENECANEVYSKLQDTGTMYSVLEQFVGEKPKAHLEWDIDNYTGNSSGKTYATNNNQLIHIDLKSDYVDNASSISLARTMLQEAIHAEMMKRMISVGHYPEATEDLENHFPEFWNYYTAYAYSWDPEEDIPRFMHNYMAEKYRDRIITGLKEFDSANGTSHTDFQYNALAWAGLKNTEAWKNFKYENPSMANNFESYYLAEANKGNSCSDFVFEKPGKI